MKDFYPSTHRFEIKLLTYVEQLKKKKKNIGFENVNRNSKSQNKFLSEYRPKPKDT